MTSIFLAFFTLLFLTAVETSFFASLGAPLAYTPLLFTAAIYVIQHRGSTMGIWWLVGYGLYLDILQIGYMPGETIIYFVAGMLAFLLSRSIFSNRSLYGIIGCGLLTLLAVFAIHFGFHAITSFFLNTEINLTQNLVYLTAQTFSFIVLTFLVFQTNQTLRKSLALRRTNS